MSEFLITTSLDTIRIETDSVAEAIKKFREHMKHHQPYPHGPSKDYYLCEIIAVEGNWNEPHEFRVLQKFKETVTQEEQE